MPFQKPSTTTRARNSRFCTLIKACGWMSEEEVGELGVVAIIRYRTRLCEIRMTDEEIRKKPETRIGRAPVALKFADRCFHQRLRKRQRTAALQDLAASGCAWTMRKRLGVRLSS